MQWHEGITRPVALAELGQRYRRYRLADPQAARSKNFFVGIASRSRDFQRDELIGVDRRNFAAGGLLLGCGS